MTDKEKLLEAARLLQEHCDGRPCPGCALRVAGKCFAKEEDGHYTSPKWWRIPEPRRWTDADIALAKALKAFGVTRVAAVNHRGTKPVWMLGENANCYLPDGAFASLKPGECVSVDDIIAEGEQE